MIEKMKFVSITGPKDDIDRVSGEYLTKYEIHLENAISELKTKENLSPFVENNPYKPVLKKAEEFLELLPEESRRNKHDINMSLSGASELVNQLAEKITAMQEELTALNDEKQELNEVLRRIVPYRHLEFDIPSIMQYQFIKFRFGKISRDYYKKFSNYVYDNLDAVFLKGQTDDEYVWGVYFASKANVDKIDTIFTSLHFERVYLPDGFASTPKKACWKLTTKIQKLNTRIKELTDAIESSLKSRSRELYAAKELLEDSSKCFDVRKLAAVTDEKHEQYFILCGWMPSKDASGLQKELKDDEQVYIIVEDDHDNILSKPPTKLKNFKLVKPYEMFIKMYGLPDYNEADPTSLVALTYAFIFGVMFGDVGQGLCLLIGGFLLYKFKGIALAAIVSSAGIFSTFFGFMFGSVFGFEDIIEAKWMHPAAKMSNLPFIGKLNTIFIIAIAFGMFIILISMILHISNSIRVGDIGSTIFDPNGIAGLVFYGSILAVVLLFMTGHKTPSGILLFIMFGIPLILIALKEPLTKKLEKKKDIMPESKVMFFVEAFFELFEMLLSYFSNTLSFVRIGAFAVSHAAMMEVVLMLAGAESGSINWIVVVLGNIFVCGMEGLIVGIQVLRLEYYEMFSRFYKGSGREFKPYLKINKKRRHVL